MAARRITTSTLLVLVAGAAVSGCAADAQKPNGNVALSSTGDSVASRQTPTVPATPAALQRCQDELKLQFADAVRDSVPATSGTPVVAVAMQDTGRAEKARPGERPAGKAAPAAPARKYRTGDDPTFAVKMGWPAKIPPLKQGAILPCHRIVAYYGNPFSRKMGVLGEYPKDEMLRRFRAAIAQWNAADPRHPVQPALQLISVVAQGAAGKDGMYRTRMPDELVQRVYGWAKQEHALLFLDVQIGKSTVQQELPRLEQYLKNPDVHLAIDPEFSMHYQAEGSKPGDKIGVMSSSDINYASQFLEQVAQKYQLPPKILIVHRFTRRMVLDAENVKLRPDVQIVMNMDGWGAEWLKRDSYRDYIIRHPVEYTGFKIFYHNDVRKAGWSLMQPADVLGFRPYPLYIQYQ